MTPAIRQVEGPGGTILRGIVRAVIYLVSASLVLFVSVMKPPGMNGNPRATVPAMIAGTAHKPFVYRQLLPGVAAVVSISLPASFRERITNVMAEPKRSTVLQYLGLERKDLLSCAIILTLMLACYIGFALTMRRLLLDLYDLPGPVVELAPVVALVLLPALFRAVPLAYDPGTLLTFTLALACLVERRTVLFYGALILAAINKETALLLIPLFGLRYAGRMKTSSLRRHLVSQTILWLVVTAVFRVTYEGNPGSSVEFHLLDHNLTLYRHPVYFAYFLALLGLGGLLLRQSWRDAPAFLRHSFVLIFGVLFGVTIFLGYIDEARDYLEAWPLFCLIVTPGVMRLFRSPVTPREVEYPLFGSPVTPRRS